MAKCHSINPRIYTSVEISMPFNKLYIRALLLCVVLGPFVWVMFTDEGQRVSDIFMLELGDSEAMNLNFTSLSNRVDETTLQEQFPQVKFKCLSQQSAFGDRQCSAPISALNGAPAQYVHAFFFQRHLTALKVGYQPSYHSYLYKGLLQSFGAGEEGPESGLRRWSTGAGLLYAPPQELTLDKEAALLWLATIN